ncbi:hypothetical protein LINPERHAP1_LOCUS30941 [Linum perenne]
MKALALEIVELRNKVRILCVENCHLHQIT